ncbi:MAG: hypothetical protein ACQEQS_10820 [Thermodesulfobacteriota bacterium]
MIKKHFINDDKMKKTIFAILAVLAMKISAHAVGGMIDVQSSFGVKETGDRLEKVLKEKGMTIFK